MFMDWESYIFKMSYYEKQSVDQLSPYQIPYDIFAEIEKIA